MSLCHVSTGVGTVTAPLTTLPLTSGVERCVRSLRMKSNPPPGAIVEVPPELVRLGLKAKLSVNAQVENPAKSVGVDISGCEDDFVGIPSCARVVVVIGQDVGCNATKAAKKPENEVEKDSTHSHWGQGKQNLC